MKPGHQFAICACGDSPYLEECILSLRAQTVPADIIISASAAGPGVRELAKRYGLPLVIHAADDFREHCRDRSEDRYKENGTGVGAPSGRPEEVAPEKETGAGGIGNDWNAALSSSEAEYVTLVHQDDRYEPDYAEKVLCALEKARREGETVLIAFTDYYEIRNGQRCGSNENLAIKRRLLHPLERRCLRHTRAAKRFALCLGNSICCPSVTYVKRQIPDRPFQNNMKSNIDWQLWEELSRQKGSFLYLPQQLVGHRIHEASATSALIGNAGRSEEDRYMLEKFWPKGPAGVIAYFYQKAENSNAVEARTDSV